MICLADCSERIGNYSEFPYFPNSAAFGEKTCGKSGAWASADVVRIERRKVRSCFFIGQKIISFKFK